MSKIPFGRFEFESEISGEIIPLKCSKGEEDQNHCIEVKFRRENNHSLGKSH